MKTYKYLILLSLVTLFSFGTGCFKDLDTVPLDKDIITSAVVYDDPESYIKVLAKLYAGLAVSGQQGPAGKADISGIDEGFGQYLRGYWYHQELPTDEAVIAWNDQTIKDFHYQTWGPDDGFIFAFYSRIFYQISLCNEFLRETTDEKLNSRNVSEDLKTKVKGYRAEARFLRALSYWHALDLFRNVPFVTEADAPGAFFPEQTNAKDLFAYIESELKDIENTIAPARTNQYGRADQAAVWTLLAKLYLNAEVYINTPKYTECLDYCKKIINAGYTLEPEYSHLFLADNDKSNEIIFPITFDGVHTRTWGGTTFIIHAAIGGKMDPFEYGVNSGWYGTRTTKQFVGLYSDLGGIIVSPNEGNTKKYPVIYVPGDYQGWDATNSETTLSSSLSDKIYEGHIFFDKDNSKFFFTPYPDISYYFGDNNHDGTLEIGGDTITISQKGLYFIKVDMNDKTYTLEKRDWSVIGDAASGWNQDIPMVWDEDEKALKVNLDLKPGQFKFRANGTWDVNLGDNDADAILEYGGDNINIAKSGTYDILLYIDKPDYTYAIKLTSYDSRGMFFSDGQNLDIDDIATFTDGYAVVKFKNITSTGEQGSDPTFPDTDFPMFRLADIYLMAAEAILRGAEGGSMTDAVNYFNKVRERAYHGTAGDITEADLNLDLLLDELAREFYWEAHRRTDLIRFGKFTGDSYLWQWKGKVKEGVETPEFRNVFPIPSPDLSNNPNLKQNEGY